MFSMHGGQNYRRSVGEFLAWFGTDEDSRDYLAWLRWTSAMIRCATGS